jgi:Cysteine-rich secretory protein family
MARGRRLLARTLGLFLGVAMLAPVLSTLEATAAHADPGSEEAQFLALTNQLRVSHGLNPLASEGGLVSIARTWSSNMAAAGAISHNMNLPHEMGGPWTKLGENVGTGWSVDSIQNAFIASPHHYENLVDPVYNYVGIGVVDSGGKIYVTVDFMQLNNTVATAAPAPVQRVSRPAATSAPRRAPVPQPVPVAAPDAPAPAPPAEAPPSPMAPTPALILALEQVRAADQ